MGLTQPMQGLSIPAQKLLPLFGSIAGATVSNAV